MAGKAVTIDKVSNPSTAAFGVVSGAGSDEDGGEWIDKEGTTLTLPFDKPGKSLPGKQLYTIKAIDPSGVLVQLPWENQINNNIASPGDALGLRFYERKGFTLLFDFKTETGTYCPTLDCWAAWGEFGGFCSALHRNITSPSASREGSIFEANATTTSSARRR
jgi:hypothetical protein